MAEILGRSEASLFFNRAGGCQTGITQTCLRPLLAIAGSLEA
jgi:hypothetical protein